MAQESNSESSRPHWPGFLRQRTALDFGFESNDAPVTALLQSNRDLAKVTDAVLQLADESRSDARVRSALGEHRPICRLVVVISKNLESNPDVTKAALRCIGNACIDNDTARSRALGLDMDWAKMCLESDNDDIKWLTVKVLYNICSSHEKSQQECYCDQRHHDLIVIATSPLAQQSDDRTLLFDLLFSITGQKAHAVETGTDQPLAPEILLRLLHLPYYHAAIADPDDFATLVEITLTFLRDSAVQAEVIEHHWVGLVWQIQQELDNKLSRLQAGANGPSETKELLQPLATSVMWCLSDISAAPRFAEEYGLAHPLVDVLKRVLQSDPSQAVAISEKIFDQSELGQRLQSEARAVRPIEEAIGATKVGNIMYATACQILGNVIHASRVDAIAPLVEQDGIHQAIWLKLVDTEEGSTSEEVQHSIAGLLIQLTRPSVHTREIIGADAKAQAGVETLWASKPPIKQDCARLLKALGRECPANQRKFEELAGTVMAQLVQESRAASAAEGGSGALAPAEEGAAQVRLLNDSS